MSATPPNPLRSLASLALALLLIYGLYLIVSPFLLPVLVGGIVTLVSRPFYIRLRQLTGSSTLSSILTVLLVAFVLLVPIAFLVTVLVHEISLLSGTIQAQAYSLPTLNRLVAEFMLSLGFTSWHPDLGSYALQALSFLESKSTLLIGGVFGTLGTVVLTFITTFYLLQCHERLHGLFLRWSPLPAADSEHILERTKEVIMATVKGNLLLVCVQGALGMLNFGTFGVGAPLLLGLLYAIASLVPAVGTSLVWVPVVLYQLAEGHLLPAAGIAIWAILQVALVDNYLGPWMIERRAHLHPFLILLGILGGVSQFGIFGFILGPTMVALGIVGLELLHRSWSRATLE